jgi:oligosaccharide repeat unit polymerase
LGLLALICLASAAIVVQFIRTTVILNKGVGVDRGGEQMAVAPWVRNIYHYIVAPLPAFQAMERNTAPFEDNGSLTFGAAARVLHELAPSFVKYPDYVQPDVLVPLPVNVYTYLGSFLLDFGIAGVVLIPLSMGAITTAVYSRMRRQPTGLRVYISGLLGLCILSSTGVNRFGTIETAIWILVPVTIVSFLSKVHRVLSVRLRKRSPGYFSGK